MIKLNKSTRYAIYALLELSKDPGRLVSAGKIGEVYKVSEHHVAKVLQQLVREGWVKSVRGINGGFQIEKDPKEITLLDVVEVFEQPQPSHGCHLLGFKESCANIYACRLADVFSEIQEQAYYTMKSITLAMLLSSTKKISLGGNNPEEL